MITFLIRCGVNVNDLWKYCHSFFKDYSVLVARIPSQLSFITLEELHAQKVSRSSIVEKFVEKDFIKANAKTDSVGRYKAEETASRKRRRMERRMKERKISSLKGKEMADARVKFAATHKQTNL